MKTCLCCGYKTIDDGSEYDICPICFWEDDPMAYDNPDAIGGANGSTSLREAQRNFAEFGACERQFIKSVRAPNDYDQKDFEWKSLEYLQLGQDDVERVDEIIIDVSDVVTVSDLHQKLKENLGFPDFYGMNWDAFWDAITGLVSMPHRLRLIGWISVESRLPRDSRIMKEMLDELNSTHKSWGCEVEYR